MPHECPEYVTVNVGPVELEASLEWDFDYDQGSWSSSWVILNVKIAQFHTEDFRELVQEAMDSQ